MNDVHHRIFFVYFSLTWNSWTSEFNEYTYFSESDEPLIVKLATNSPP